MIKERNESNNNVRLCGKILEELKFTHSNHGEKFYETKISIKRDSGIEDVIPLVLSERLNNLKNVEVDDFVDIEGEFRSYNTYEHQLKLFVFVKKIDIIDYERYFNKAVLTGYICKSPIFRKTPRGCQITDVLIAVGRQLKYRSDYIPVIFWGRNAEYTETLSVGDKIEIVGRIQSRNYIKKLPNGTAIEKTAYELSVYNLFEKNEE